MKNKKKERRVNQDAKQIRSIEEAEEWDEVDEEDKYIDKENLK